MSGDPPISPSYSLQLSLRVATRAVESTYRAVRYVKLSFLVGKLRELRPELRDRTDSDLLRENPGFSFTCGWFELAKFVSEDVPSSTFRLSRAVWDGKESIPLPEPLA